MGRNALLPKTGAGQHGVATATVAALFGLKCDIYMGEEDVHRQALNVFRMRLLGARVIPVASGSRTLKDSINEAMRDWVTKRCRYALHYRNGDGAAPLPNDGLRISIRDRPRGLKQLRTKKISRPDYLVACVGGGSNSIGLFHPFSDAAPE